MRRLSMILVAVFLGGCRQQIGTLTIASSNNVNYEKVMDARRFGAVGEREGTVREHWILFFPVMNWPCRIEEAMADACAGAADCMVDVQIKQWWWTIGIYTQQGFTVYGTPLNTYAITPSSEEVERRVQGKTP